MTEPILETRGLYKFYGTDGGKVAVVRDLSLSVPQGRLVTVMGPSGSGKSTLLHMVSGLEPPSGGTVRLAGHDLYALSEKKRTLLRRDLVGFVFQFYNLIPNLTVEQNIRLPLLIGAGRLREPALAGTGAGPDVGAPTADALEQLVDFLRLGGKLSQYPHQLSGGEMQRVSIARALVARPAIVMADEPTGNISSSAGEEVMGLFRRSCDELGQTILLVTHNARDAAWSDEVRFLKDGELHEEAGLAGEAVTPEGIAESLARLGI
ncbi:MAG: ABC transporter ATP-binding protein [Planctomycetota bacterium]|jgi:putative ABC transport system ATP-binding protein